MIGFGVCARGLGFMLRLALWSNFPWHGKYHGKKNKEEEEEE